MRFCRRMPPFKTEAAKLARFNPTKAEAHLLKALRAACPWRVRFQSPMLGYIADFYIAKANLVVEADGGYHIGRQAQDAIRDSRLAEIGMLTLRFTNEAILGNVGAVVEEILAVASTRLEERRKPQRKSAKRTSRQASAEGALFAGMRA